jgi:hypothetical protein
MRHANGMGDCNLGDRNSRNDGRLSSTNDDTPG